ncbi:helix-hairpin-helix domain-containing protein [Aureispira anguillae]|uniref:Helix-hairpin-helix domain-containing protein n=1 Tax=Aureispira anguillae TaxID=2864201 RepID=A0A915YHQ9_9BACT|nr:helix-hairpin-helix domain-containing protein [Aureispira anguillae]BDS13186.1 helix-hairpin-helix domain-containing protein [Aureispira anguillae]
MNGLKDFFYYTRTERNGILVLLGLLLILLILPYTFGIYRDDSTINFENWEADLNAFEEGLARRPIAHQHKKKFPKKDPLNALRGGSPKKITPLSPVSFDPNTATAMDLEVMGLPERTIKGILNYRAKGGHFRNKEALQKIYTLSEEHYQQLYPFINLKREKEQASEKEVHKSSKAIELLPAFDFDPNTATAEVFEKLGLSTKTIRSILNYRTKGGQFRKREDFKKIYTLPDTLYQHLSAYIKIVAQPQLAVKRPYQAKKYYTIDINTAGQDDFQQFRGIGPSYAKRILKMKESLGGFLTIQQVGEVYKLPDSTFQAMQPYLTCAPISVQKININTATLEELKAHPYLRWFHAKAIIKYREEEGLWKSVDLIQILTEFDDGKGTFKKIKPYLTVD